MGKTGGTIKMLLWGALISNDLPRSATAATTLRCIYNIDSMIA